MRIVFFTGAGISQESGLQTFRDAGGIWEGYAVNEVCSADAWKKAPERVLAFYNARRRAVRQALPNSAHKAIAGLENSQHQVTVVTQNIDDLHERAGSQNVLHLHGEILKSRSVLDEMTLYECPNDIQLGDTRLADGQLRPHVVFFGEAIYNYDAARSFCKRADVLVIVGTSLAVYPAAYLVQGSNARTVYIVDPIQPGASRLGWEGRRIIPIKRTACEGVPEAIAKIQAHTNGTIVTTGPSQ